MSFFAPVTNMTASVLTSIIAPIAIGTLSFLVGGCGDGGGPDSGPRPLCDPENNDECNDCHSSPYDWRSVPFFVWCKEEKIGVHRAHRETTVTDGIFCNKCHPMPASADVPLPDDPTPHINGQGDIIVAGNKWIDSYDSDKHQCTSYCHGDGNKMSWLVKDAYFKLTCTDCHNQTKPAHDVTDPKECSTCHDQTMNSDGSFKSLSLHINGEVDVSGEICATCHGQPPVEHTTGIDDPMTLGLLELCSNCHPNVTAPFRDSPEDLHRNGVVDFKEEGLCTTCHMAVPPTGAHERHNAPLTKDEPIGCPTCHDVPTQDNRLLGHLAPPTVIFSGLALINQHGDPLTPVYDSVSQGCTNVYCHGGGLYAGQLIDPLLWSGNTGGACLDCHAVPPETEPQHGTENCATCHGSMLDTSQHIDGIVNGPTGGSIDDGCAICHDSPPANHLAGVVDPTIISLVNTCSNCHTDVTTPFETVTHRNGELNFTPTLCSSCHGDPPSTGAHDDHISPSLAWTIECTTCHDVIPTQDTNLLNHLSSPIVTLSGLATVNLHGPNPIVPVYDSMTKGCSTVYCHGGGLVAGQSSEVFWNDASGTQDDCGACHDMPPANPPHAPLTCTTCHSFFLHEHVNGTVNMLSP